MACASVAPAGLIDASVGVEGANARSSKDTVGARVDDGKTDTTPSPESSEVAEARDDRGTP